ncbi:MAG: single-stranded DNA-binding protein [Candidatus Omnitrophota bacterium]|nr:single-stranded DNA-binding protein [Candidatus Omnitrophota bacterium]MDZ4243215.1 single-stranded DNA-binding protein [Candidatus Omnitrophota bacterium]
MSLNSVNVMGNLTRDPELKYTPSGKAVCVLSIANNRVYTKNNEKVNEVSYFDVEVWGVVAENCAKYLAKGHGIIVEGRLKQDRWEKDGKTQSRVRIVAGNVHFLPKKQREGTGGGSYDQPAESAPEAHVAEAPSADTAAWDG